MTLITLTQPDDWHLHLRDGDALQSVIAHTAKQFARAIVMPNLNPPITTTASALAYRERILQALNDSGLESVRNDGKIFTPLMTLYLTDETDADEIDRAVDSTFIHGVKLYPANATTNSAAGVTDWHKTIPVLERMQKLGMPLLVHGEVMDKDIDPFDREHVFIDRVFKPMMRILPALKIVFEHITTKEAVQFVESVPATLAATITAHHLLYDRNDLFRGGIRPHFYCLPILKRAHHRKALLAAVASGNPKFFLGTDSAPHAKHKKETACGCAGIYTAHAAIELYAEAFESVNALDKLEGFASFYGADFYGLPRNSKKITLEKKSQLVPESFTLGEDQLIPLRAGETISWSLL